ncbi:hypothetical protein [Lysinibacillus fusiformis]|uniref:hypothetical protein n=1 Tax=Lysinibacillus fusiformis TaxID=28031 RepID=UPI0008E35706|nr:hypothetical protein [Lysinibacillus fusiformis]SFS35004.1 hypothetical protein SAMN02787099_00270 [Lysinibacillus fusiformis]
MNEAQKQGQGKNHRQPKMKKESANHSVNRQKAKEEDTQKHSPKPPHRTGNQTKHETPPQKQHRKKQHEGQQHSTYTNHITEKSHGRDQIKYGHPTNKRKEKRPHNGSQPETKKQNKAHQTLAAKSPNQAHKRHPIQSNTPSQPHEKVTTTQEKGQYQRKQQNKEVLKTQRRRQAQQPSWHAAHNEKIQENQLQITAIIQKQALKEKSRKRNTPNK